MKRREALKNTLLALGYTITVPSLINIFESCNNNTKQGWQPQFFSSEQIPVISELTEAILPRTKTPGAKDLHADQFIDQLLKRVLSPDDQKSFLKGMDAFEAKSKEVNGKSFMDSSPEQRTKLLHKLESETRKTTPSIWGISMKENEGPLPFYRRVKELTLLAFFTSEQIGKKVLVYNPVPGKFVADMPMVQPGYISFE